MIELPCYPLVPVAYIAILCISIMMNTIAIVKRIISHCIIAIAICNGYVVILKLLGIIGYLTKCGLIVRFWLSPL